MAVYKHKIININSKYNYEFWRQVRVSILGVLALSGDFLVLPEDVILITDLCQISENNIDWIKMCLNLLKVSLTNAMNFTEKFPWWYFI